MRWSFGGRGLIDRLIEFDICVGYVRDDAQARCAAIGCEIEIFFYQITRHARDE
jgi:hypothetical protein